MKNAEFAWWKFYLAALAAACLVLTGCGPQVQSSEGESPKSEDSVFLFSNFHNEQDGLRFAYSFDGYHWTNIPGIFLRPEVGSKIMRDPSISQGPDGTFHLVWTTAWHDDLGFGYAESKDLIHWSEQQFVPAMTNEPTTVNVWAPELFYDSRSNEFVITWASTIPGRFPDGEEAHDNNHRMYFTTTKDFKTFTPTTLFLDPGFSVIDCQILQDGNRYVLLLKDNTRPERDIKVAFADSPFGPWKGISKPVTEQFTEGPCALKIGDDWIIYFDAYRQKIYGAVKTRDFKTFTDITDEVSFPEGTRHGTAFSISRKILDSLLQNKP